jgi:hypothetical protein
MQCWEHRRFVVRSCGREIAPGELPPAAIIVPVKGVDLQLRESLHSLLHQDYPRFEVHFVGENQADPAFPVVKALMQDNPPCTVHWHSAGIAERCGQKVHNLLAATESLNPDVAVIAFADSDAHPGRNWLRCLAWRLLSTDPRLGAATGYRCCVPASAGLGNYFLYAINSSVSSMLTPAGPNNLLWGGSWMIRRETFEQSQLRDAWRGTLSDDMVASRSIRQLGKRIGYEPHITVPSSSDMRFGALMEFVRRQFFMVRNYAPWLWLLLLAAWTVNTLAFWGSLAVAATAAAAGAAWWWVPAAYVGGCYLLGVWRARLRQAASAASLPALQRQLRQAQRWELWAGPLVSLIGWLGILASAVSRHVQWRGIRYRLGESGRVHSVRHRPTQAPGSRAA